MRGGSFGSPLSLGPQQLQDDDPSATARQLPSSTEALEWACRTAGELWWAVMGNQARIPWHKSRAVFRGLPGESV